MTFPGAEKIAEEAGKFASQMASQQVADIMKGMWSAWTGNMETSQREQTSERASEDTPMADDTQGKKSESSDNNAGVSEPQGKSSTAEKVSETPTTEPEQEEVILVDTEDSNQNQSGKNSPTGAEDWTLLNKEKDQTRESSQNSTPRETRDSADTSTRQIYPNLPSAPLAPSAPHPNARVNSALEQMRGMGYSDEGGWLTRLLEMKDGDINKVLDILLVQKK
ncbi:Sequestosome-1 [Armadillidium vulgare]|nr:Sequestosome-1 [Armadillidium vulgare]